MSFEELIVYTTYRLSIFTLQSTPWEFDQIVPYKLGTMFTF